MKTLRLFLLSIFLLQGWVFAQDRKIAFNEYNLANGLHVILHQDRSIPVVAISVLYHVGSKNEDPKRTGFAHFFEHLMFEGSEHIKRAEFPKLVQKAGGVLNANTTFDRTFFYQVLPSHQLELGLWMEAERMLHAKIDSTGMEAQRAIVKEERKQRLDGRPYGSALEEICKRAFTKHPYQWLPIGSNQYIDEATLNEFKAFYQTYYVPKNATLCIAGDFDSKTTGKWIEKYFKDIPVGSKPINRVSITEPPLGKEIRDTIYDNIQLPAIFMAYRVPGMKHKDSYSIDLLNMLLSNGNSSRLYKQLVDKKELAVNIGSLPIRTEDPGLSMIYSIAAPGIKLDDLEDAIEEEVMRLKTRLVSEKELAKLKNQMESRLIEKKSSLVGIAETLSNYHVYHSNSQLINTVSSKYKNITSEELKRVANTYLNKENRVILYYLPNPQTKED